MNLPAVTETDHAEVLRRQVDAFLRTRKSDHTRAGYRRDLSHWIGWCIAHGLWPLGPEVRPGHVQMWLADLRDEGDSDSTRARRLSSVSSWYRWLTRQEAFDRNPADLDTNDRPPVNRGRSDSLALSPQQTDTLIAAADADSPRTSALVALLAVTGARVGEILAANVDDLTYMSGQRVLPIMGKGRRKRPLPLPPSVSDRIDAYLATRRDQPDRLPALQAGSRPARPLFVTATGGRLDRKQVRRDLKRLAKDAGGDLAAVADRLSPHVTRHSYATDLLNAGAPLRDVQYAMGHASPVTTERYDHGDLHQDRHPTYRRAGQVGR